VLDALAGYSGFQEREASDRVDDERQQGILAVQVVRNGARGGGCNALSLEALRLRTCLHQIRRVAGAVTEAVGATTADLRVPRGERLT